MTRRPDLGSILAIAAAAVAGVAIVVGFIIVGGPGDARDRRLDELTLQKIGQVVGVAQCAFDASGVAPIDYLSATKTRSAPAPNTPPALCDGGAIPLQISTGATPASPGEIIYEDSGPTQVRICGKFHAAQNQNEAVQTFLPLSDVYPVLTEPHPAGVHCYVLDLVKSGVPLNGPERLPEAPSTPIP